MAASYGLIIHQMDVKTAFPNVELEEEIYIDQRRGSLPPAVNLYRSCVELGWLERETTRFILVLASEE
jgi:hypothetical protein